MAFLLQPARDVSILKTILRSPLRSFSTLRTFPHTATSGRFCGHALGQYNWKVACHWFIWNKCDGQNRLRDGTRWQRQKQKSKGIINQSNHVRIVFANLQSRRKRCVSKLNLYIYTNVCINKGCWSTYKLQWRYNRGFVFYFGEEAKMTKSRCSRQWS